MAFNLQDEQLLNINPNVQNLIITSTQRFLTGTEMDMLFQNLDHLPLSQVTVGNAPGLFRLRCDKFIDENEDWNRDNNGRKVRGGELRVNGEVWFNYTVAQSAQLVRRTIRWRTLYGIETFVHYMNQ